MSTFLAAIGGWRYARASAPVNGPIVLISMDGVRADHLPAYGSATVPTPALAALAADGIVFERAFSHSPQTLPSHASLLTGRLPFEHGVRDSAGFALPAGERTIAEMLADRGYATGGVVSSFLLRKDTGIAQGFALFDADLGDNPDESPVLQRDDDASAQVAEHWLESVGTDRAFLFLHLSDLDRPLEPGETPAAGDRERIRAADAAIGRLVKYLKSHQLYDRTTIVVTSDHGEAFGEHGETGHGLFTYDTTLRVPLIVKQPGAESGGRRVADVVQIVDIVPTILDLAKAPIPGNLRGKSLVPLFEGDRRGPTLVYAESLYSRYHHGWSELLSITDGRYRFISAPAEELYDLESDPAENDNVIAAHPDIADRLRSALKSFSSAPLTRRGEIPVAVRDAIEAFGYVGDVDGAPSSGPVADPKERAAFVADYRAAVDAAYAGEWDRAIERFKALTAAEPARADAWRHLATAATRGERADVAADAFAKASELSPADTNSMLGAASAYLRARKPDEARRYAQQALDTPGATPQTLAIGHEILARIALAAKDAVKARAEADLAEQALPTWPVRAYVDGRLAMERKHYEGALEFFEPALVRMAKPAYQPLADLRLLTAEAYIALQRWSEAEYLLDQEMKERGVATRARGLLATVYKSTGRTTEASELAAH